jgi:hypothetical protein
MTSASSRIVSSPSCPGWKAAHQQHLGVHASFSHLSSI